MSTLADLRRQNMSEQKGEESPVLADAEVRTSALPQVREEKELEKPNISVSTEIRKPARTQARKEGSTGGRKQASTQVSTEALTPVPKDVSADALLERVREAIEQKRNHRGGVKATVDMSPELSKRAKTYCLESDVSSVRVLCLELLDAFLTEEGF
jgi:hypothetical protein